MRELISDRSARPLNNLAVSPRGIAGLWGYGSFQSLTHNVPISNHPSAKTAVRVNYIATSANPGVGFASVPIGQAVRARADVYVEAGAKAGFALALQGQSSAAGQTLPLGQWVTLEWTSPVATEGNRNIAVRTNTVDVDGSFLVTNVVIQNITEDALRTYADGDSPGWRWLGTPGQSESVGYPWALDSKIVRREITNLIRGTTALPEGATQVGWIPTRADLTYTSGAAPGEQAIRLTVNQVGFMPRIALHNTYLPPAIPNQTYTVLARMRSAGSVWANMQPLTSGLSNAGGVLPDNPVLSNGSWVWVTATMKMPPEAAFVSVYLGAPTNSPVGTVVDIDRIMLVEGSDTGVVFANGNTPGWRWLGTPNASESRGFPYTLESIAGPPDISIAAGVGAASSSFAVFPPLGGRTTYVVTDRNSTGTATQAVIVNTVQSTVNQTGQIRLNNARFEFRPQFVQGGGAGGVYASFCSIAPAVGTRNIVCAAQTDGLTSYDLEVNGGLGVGARITRTGMDAGVGYTDNPTPGPNAARATSGGTYEVPIFVVQFAAYHDQETRRRVAAWLARRYGGPIPAGY